MLARHGIQSGRCEEAAREMLPIGRERDRDARAWRLFPREGRYVVPKVRLERPWYFHVTVEAEAHYVDALTGAYGTPSGQYLVEHWNEADAIRWIAEQELA